ncbi:hypothetical protein ACOMHN_064388 [Nucella lapillus]
MAQLKAQNDPWTPLPEKADGILQPPCDPRHQLIDSDRYIESLERRLKRLKGRNKPELSSRDIINSIAGFKDDQMRRFLQNGHSITAPPPYSSSSITDDATTTSASYLQRKLYPERQALNTEELFELLKDDELTRIKLEEEEEEEAEHKPAASLAKSANLAENGRKDDENLDVGKESDSTSSAVKEKCSDVREDSSDEQGVKLGDGDTKKQSDDVNSGGEDKEISEKTEGDQ